MYKSYSKWCHVEIARFLREVQSNFGKNYGQNVRFTWYNSEKIGCLAVSKFLSFSNSAIPNTSYKLHKFLHSLRPVGKKKKGTQQLRRGTPSWYHRNIVYSTSTSFPWWARALGLEGENIRSARARYGKLVLAIVFVLQPERSLLSVAKQPASIQTSKSSSMNQSEIEAIPCSLSQARENARLRASLRFVELLVDCKTVTRLFSPSRRKAFAAIA